MKTPQSKKKFYRFVKISLVVFLLISVVNFIFYYFTNKDRKDLVRDDFGHWDSMVKKHSAKKVTANENWQKKMQELRSKGKFERKKPARTVHNEDIKDLLEAKSQADIQKVIERIKSQDFRPSSFKNLSSKTLWDIHKPPTNNQEYKKFIHESKIHALKILVDKSLENDPLGAKLMAGQFMLLKILELFDYVDHPHRKSQKAFTISDDLDDDIFSIQEKRKNKGAKRGISSVNILSNKFSVGDENKRLSCKTAEEEREEAERKEFINNMFQKFDRFLCRLNFLLGTKKKSLHKKNLKIVKNQLKKVYKVTGLKKIDMIDLDFRVFAKEIIQKRSTLFALIAGGTVASYNLILGKLTQSVTLLLFPKLAGELAIDSFLTGIGIYLGHKQIYLLHEYYKYSKASSVVFKGNEQISFDLVQKKNDFDVNRVKFGDEFHEKTQMAFMAFNSRVLEEKIKDTMDLPEKIWMFDRLEEPIIRTFQSFSNTFTNLFAPQYNAEIEVLLSEESTSKVLKKFVPIISPGSLFRKFIKPETLIRIITGTLTAGIFNLVLDFGLAMIGQYRMIYSKLYRNIDVDHPVFLSPGTYIVRAILEPQEKKHSFLRNSREIFYPLCKMLSFDMKKWDDKLIKTRKKACLNMILHFESKKEVDELDDKMKKKIKFFADAGRGIDIKDFQRHSKESGWKYYIEQASTASIYEKVVWLVALRTLYGVATPSKKYLKLKNKILGIKTGSRKQVVRSLRQEEVFNGYFNFKRLQYVVQSLAVRLYEKKFYEDIPRNYPLEKGFNLYFSYHKDLVLRFVSKVSKEWEKEYRAKGTWQRAGTFVTNLFKSFWFDVSGGVMGVLEDYRWVYSIRSEKDPLYGLFPSYIEQEIHWVLSGKKKFGGLNPIVY